MMYRTRNRKQLGRKLLGKDVKFWGGSEKQSALEQRVADCSRGGFQPPEMHDRQVTFNQPYITGSPKQQFGPSSEVHLGQFPDRSLPTFPWQNFNSLTPCRTLLIIFHHIFFPENEPDNLVHEVTVRFHVQHSTLISRHLPQCCL